MFRKSSIWRLTLIYTALSTVLVSLVLLVLYYFSVGQVVRAQDRNFYEVLAQHQLLTKQLSQTEYQLQFGPEFQLSESLSLTFQADDAPVDVVGRLSSVPVGIAMCPEISRFPVYQARYDDIEILSGCTLPAYNGRVLIAQNRQQLDRWIKLFWQTSLGALLITLVIGTLSGWWFSRKLIRKVSAVNQIARKVEDGDLTARISIGKSGDEFDQMAMHINRMLGQLEDNFETVRGTTDAIAHDLRTPLSRLRLRLEHLVSQETETVKADALADVLEELDRIILTFKSMLELTKLEHGLMNAGDHPVDLQALVSDAVELIEPLADENRQTITVNASPVYVQGDPSLLFRVIYNLLDNAVKYSGENASVLVELTEKALIIADNGVGIAEEEMTKAFQRLSRLDSSRTTPGYGLGLPVVKAILKLHGMKIKMLDNEPGLKVVIRLPRPTGSK
ncbi:HAMP domain-containing histidine kinase [Litoribacillus peritrichatus]|uniref:histidine kinase n=2 Tax=Litoribacillus peritrichatus TaxID=718191 RepID=A0ABP7LZ97_9GAMM